MHALKVEMIVVKDQLENAKKELVTSKEANGLLKRRVEALQLKLTAYEERKESAPIPVVKKTLVLKKPESPSLANLLIKNPRKESSRDLKKWEKVARKIMFSLYKHPLSD